jgi:hypothetical protein
VWAVSMLDRPLLTTRLNSRCDRRMRKGIDHDRGDVDRAVYRRNARLPNTVSYASCFVTPLKEHRVIVSGSLNSKAPTPGGRGGSIPHFYSSIVSFAVSGWIIPPRAKKFLARVSPHLRI